MSLSDENEYYAYSSDEDNDVFMSQHNDDDDDADEEDEDTSLDPDEKEAMALENPNAAPVQSSFFTCTYRESVLLISKAKNRGEDRKGDGYPHLLDDLCECSLTNCKLTPVHQQVPQHLLRVRFA